MMIFKRRASSGFIIFLAALGIVVSGIAMAAADDLGSLTSWAEKTTPMSWQRGNMRMTPTAVKDHFGRVPYDAWTKRGQNGLGYPGLSLPTAGVGSSWVYDAAHHIAGGTEYNDDGGWDDVIAYAPSPPSKLPSRDLSGVVSSLGLHLGMSVQQAADDLGAPVKAAQKIDQHHDALSVLRDWKPKNDCGTRATKARVSDYFTLVVFSDGHAVYIQEGIDGSDGG